MTQLFDQEATASKILQSVEDLIRESGPDTQLVIYFGGHGVESDGEPAWVAHDFKRTSSEDHSTRDLKFRPSTSSAATPPPTHDLRVTGSNLVLFRDIKTLLKKSPAKQRVIFIDACAASPVAAWQAPR